MFRKFKKCENPYLTTYLIGLYGHLTAAMLLLPITTGWQLVDQGSAPRIEDSIDNCFALGFLGLTWPIIYFGIAIGCIIGNDYKKTAKKLRQFEIDSKFK